MQVFADCPVPRLKRAVWPSELTVDSTSKNVHQRPEKSTLLQIESHLPSDYLITPGCRPVFPKPLAYSSNVRHSYVFLTVSTALYSYPLGRWQQH